MAALDHLILEVDDLETSLHFSTELMGLAAEGEDGPFSVVRVDATTVLLAPFGSGRCLIRAADRTHDH
jgi:catechol 2,3-dioxygenase-like lactoylglutathione lyase family enzyme